MRDSAVNMNKMAPQLPNGGERPAAIREPLVIFKSVLENSPSTLLPTPLRFAPFLLVPFPFSPFYFSFFLVIVLLIHLSVYFFPFLTYLLLGFFICLLAYFVPFCLSSVPIFCPLRF
jgi:hypothetical protein